MHPKPLHNHARSAWQQNHTKRVGCQLTDSYASSGKPTRVSGTRQRTMALFGWRATLATSQCHQQALVVFLRSLAKQKPTTPSTLPLLVCGRLFGRFKPTLFTADHLDGGRFLTRSSERRPLAEALPWEYNVVSQKGVELTSRVLQSYQTLKK